MEGEDPAGPLGDVVRVRERLAVDVLAVGRVDHGGAGEGRAVGRRAVERDVAGRAGPAARVEPVVGDGPELLAPLR